MTVSGACSWDVNPSVRPGRNGDVLAEYWTFRCARPDGAVLQEAEIELRRGEEKPVSCG
ncbi:hypothetical protein [Amycolatopsis sp. H20-H5]|uniref:hypothetical protein n=1 Tax=Amycolatopsis sp. H20-H5 TaxID=3046309 RepID=UPI002DB613AE|nr:hypothetical protein [Amycolatopsis sp. H20-H5]MEC3974173.1 hypothetical protein [Amycolatopsis sp. H20-H5]